VTTRRNSAGLDRRERTPVHCHRGGHWRRQNHFVPVAWVHRSSASGAEQFEENPFLKDFYRDLRTICIPDPDLFPFSPVTNSRGALSQADLFHRFLLTDYIFEKDKIFAYLNLEDEELKLYETLVKYHRAQYRPADLVVYLQSSVPRLMLNIKRRGRSYETSMVRGNICATSTRHIITISSAYKATPLLIVNAAEIDFCRQRGAVRGILVRQIFRPNRAAVEYYNPVLKK